MEEVQINQEVRDILDMNLQIVEMNKQIVEMNKQVLSRALNPTLIISGETKP